MGLALATTELPVDMHSASGSSNRYASFPSIHLGHAEVDMLKRTFSLYQGSGGKLASLPGTAPNEAATTPSGANTQVHAAPANTLAIAVKEICLAFGLTKDELAQACKIQSRKTLYNWINGEAKPRKSAMSRVFDLLIIARAWHSSGFVTDREQLDKPVLGDQSVFDLLRQPEIDKECILFAGSRLNLMSPVKNDLSDPFA